MSAVDCIDHVHVGDFNDEIGIYWPLWEGKLSDVTDEKEEDNISLSPYKLLIGGGSGEHPAMHVINDAAVLHFFCLGYLFDYLSIPEENWNIEDEDVSVFFKKLERVSYEYSNRYTEKDRWYWTINQNHWPLETFVELDRAFEAVGLKYPHADVRAQMSKVLTDIFGAIIVEKMPLEAIHDEELKELVLLFKEHKEKLEPFMLPDYLDKLMMFFDQPEHTFGRNLTIKGNNLNTGYSLEDWQRDFKK